MTMSLYDTAKQAVVPFTPDHLVTMYTCGITPYDSAHLGHVATYLAYDILQRRLRDLGHETRCVRNVTDVDDDLLRKSRELGVYYLDLAAEETMKFDRNMSAMKLIPSYSEPRATSAISEILKMIGQLIESGHAYQAGGAVYYEIASFSGFGEVSHYDRPTMLKLSAERGGDINDPHKRDPLDFILWQPSLPDEPSWESRWGAGRPGWHIECSALAMRELGTTIDLHGGGSDLIYPPHECEAAQSESASGFPFVRHWMHVGMVCLDGEKMSKSLGNLVFVGDLLESYESDAIRLALLSQHYRSSFEWKHQLLTDAESQLARWRSTGRGDAAIDQVRERLDDDLDTAGALRAIDDAVSRSEGVSETASLLGVSTAP